MMGFTGAATVSRRRAMRSVFRVLCAAALASFVTGCAGLETTPPAGAMLAGQARLKLTRVSGVLYMGAQANVRVNGQEVANLWRDSSTTVNLSPGANVITVGALLHPGVWTINLHAKPGATYAIEISPRVESYAPVLIAGLAGSMVDAAVNENAGAFQMRLLK
jgi:hypothetical protein